MTGELVAAAEETLDVAVVVNGRERSERVPVRRLLSDFLRHDLRLTGTHVGCEHGVCGCCTVLVDGAAVRSCLMLAVQASGSEILTIEGLSGDGEPLHPIQRAFQESHGLQCGFCTPGFVMAVYELLEGDDRPTLEDDDEIREAISGNLCRCTGYQHIVDAVRCAEALMREDAA